MFQIGNELSLEFQAYPIIGHFQHHLALFVPILHQISRPQWLLLEELLGCRLKVLDVAQIDHGQHMQPPPLPAR